MKRRKISLALSACIFLLVAAALLMRSQTTVHAVSAAAIPPSTGCAFPVPADWTGNSDALAWRLFVAANCPNPDKSGPPLTWETWHTQEQVFASAVTGAGKGPLAQSAAAISASVQRFHPSVQARAIHPTFSARTAAPQLGAASGGAAKALNALPADCSSTQTNSMDPYTGGNRNRTMCEEVRLNKAAEDYIRNNHLNTAEGQAAFVQRGEAITFPPEAIEIKADWERNCPAGTPALHSETIAGVPYCLVAMHMDSKLLPNWLWATWETTNSWENPARCYAIGCKDTFGFSPSVVPGGYDSLKIRQAQRMTQQLSQLEANAGLESQLRNYVMDGSQTEFVDPNGNPTLLGNSVTEGEMAGVDLRSASCITCHKVSVVNASAQQNLGPLDMAMVGAPPLVPGYASRDFLWTFIIIPTKDPNGKPPVTQGYNPIPYTRP